MNNQLQREFIDYLKFWLGSALGTIALGTVLAWAHRLACGL